MKLIKSSMQILVAVVAVLSLSVVAWSQTGTSTVRGTVTDAQGAVVSGAELTLTNQANGNVRSMKTADSGSFNFDLITPGEYRLDVAAKGFKKQTIDNVRALIAKLSEVSVQLEVGAATEVVEVQGSSAGFLVNSQDASLGNNFVSEQMTQLPLEARNIGDLLSLQPGATKEGYVTGARADQTNITLDGVDVNNAQTANTALAGKGGVIASFVTDTGNITQGPALRLNSEATEEFRVTTANGGANQGRSSGSQVNLSSKSGGNAFHGAAFELYRTKWFTSNDWFANHNGQPRADLVRNQFSGGIGGPIIKDKVFFYYNYEGRRDIKSTLQNTIVPLAQSPDPLNAGNLGDGVMHYRYCVDPACSTTAVGSLDAVQMAATFPNAVAFELSSPLLNPVAQAALAAAIAKYPSNNTTIGDGLNTGGISFNSPFPLKLNQHIAKFDFNLTKNQTAFVRFTDQMDKQTLAAYLPGAIAPQIWSHPWGIAAGHTWTIGQNWVNSFRYGYTRQAFTQGGDSFGNDVWFRFVFQPNGQTHSISRVSPVNTLADDISWIHGNHSLQFGTNIRTISNGRVSFANAFDNGLTNPSGYFGGGDLESQAVQDYLTAQDLPGNGVTDGGLNSVSETQAAATALIGRLTQYTGNFTFGKDGSLLNSGTPSTRTFITRSSDFYVQDSWKARSNLTLTFGLRYTLERPVSEKKGFEVRPVVPLDAYFAQRIAASKQGQNFTDPVVVNLSGPANKGKPMYDWDYKNFQPSVGFAWTPAGAGGKTVVRGGFKLASDYYGQALAVDFDLNNTLGFTSSSNINVNTYSSSGAPVPLPPLFSSYTQDVLSLGGLNIPSKLTFPLSAGLDYSERIEQSLNSSLRSPKHYIWNLTFERQMRAGLVLSASYIGRKAQHLLARRDVAAFNDLVDPKTGMDWYQAATILEKQRQQGVVTDAIASIPYFDNLFPAGLVDIVNDCSFLCAGFDPAWTNTQTVYAFQSRSKPSNPVSFFGGNDWTDNQALLDQTFSFFDLPTLFMSPQYGALSAWDTIANSYYNAFTFSARQRLKGLTLDVNYSYSHSLDDSSGLQIGGAYGAAFIENPLRQRDNYGTSDFDTKHVITASAVWEVPFGKGQKFAGGAGKLADALIGGWQISSIFRFNSGLPVGGPADDSRWATNWNVQAGLTAINPVKACPNRPSVGSPKIFGCAPDLTKVYQSFRNAYPGETGPRNPYRIPSYVNVDMGIGKSFKMPWNETHSLQLRLDAFNLANHQSMGANDNSRTGYGIVRDPARRGSIPPSNWSNFTDINGSFRSMQITARYSF